MALHLSQHHGDGMPGSALLLHLLGIEAFDAEITAKGYAFTRPGNEPAASD
jgi:hypothetical protein